MIDYLGSLGPSRTKTKMARPIPRQEVVNGSCKDRRRGEYREVDLN